MGTTMSHACGINSLYLVLQFFPGTGGSFLVRESTTSPGDYVLSVLWADRVHHIQILRHENDAFFSIGKILKLNNENHY